MRDVIRRQQELNDLCRRKTQQAQIDKNEELIRTADAKAYSVPGGSSTKGNPKVAKKNGAVQFK